MNIIDSGPEKLTGLSRNGLLLRNLAIAILERSRENLTNRPQFSMVYAVIDHRNDVLWHTFYDVQECRPWKIVFDLYVTITFIFSFLRKFLGKSLVTCYVISMVYLTNRFHVAVRLFSNRSQMTSKCHKNKEVAHEP